MLYQQGTRGRMVNQKLAGSFAFLLARVWKTALGQDNKPLVAMASTVYGISV